MLTDKRKKFLEHFPVDRRSTVANKFLEVIRKGIDNPEAVLTSVYEKMRETDDRSYISDAIYEFMSAVRSYMSQEEPTEKQLSYLRALGYTGKTPETKAQASELISTIKVFNKLKVG